MKTIIAPPLGRVIVTLGGLTQFVAHFWALSDKEVAMSTSPELVGCEWMGTFGPSIDKCLAAELQKRGLHWADVDVSALMPPTLGPVGITTVTEEETQDFLKAVKRRGTKKVKASVYFRCLCTQTMEEKIFGTKAEALRWCESVSRTFFEAPTTFTLTKVTEEKVKIPSRLSEDAS